jgi:hypothetical protein
MQPIPICRDDVRQERAPTGVARRSTATRTRREWLATSSTNGTTRRAARRQAAPRQPRYPNSSGLARQILRELSVSAQPRPGQAGVHDRVLSVSYGGDLNEPQRSAIQIHPGASNGSERSERQWHSSGHCGGLIKDTGVRTYQRRVSPHGMARHPSTKVVEETTCVSQTPFFVHVLGTCYSPQSARCSLYVALGGNGYTFLGSPSRPIYAAIGVPR